MADSDEPDDRFVYSVRPDPPQFDELIRRPALFSDESPFRPPGPILRRLGHNRARTLFRLGLVAAVMAVVAMALG